MLINQLICNDTQAGEIEEAETMRSMLVHEGWQPAELLPQGWRWRQDPKVILGCYGRDWEASAKQFTI